MQGRCFKWFVVIFALSTLVAGCGSTKISAQKQDDDRLTTNQDGYLLIGLVNNYSLDALYIWGDTDLQLTEEDLSAGENYILVPIPSGNYQLGQINYNYYFRTKLDDDIWRFTIAPGQINYIGHLTVNRPNYWFFSNNIELKNRAASARLFMEKYFPSVLSERKLTYAGPGEDKFFDFIAQLETSNE